MANVITDRRLGVNAGLAIKVPCVAATTGNITLAGEQTVDGVVCVTGNRVLVKNQTSAVDNGIYEVDTGSWTRSPDADGTYDITAGTLVSVVGGVQSGGLVFRQTESNVVIGTSAMNWGPVFYSSLTPLDFGAVGDGVADDSVAIQEAIDAAGAMTGTKKGHVVVDLVGRQYGINTTLSTDGIANVSIENGGLVAVGTWTATDFIIEIKQTGTYGEMRNIALRNVTIDCATKCNGVYFEASYDCGTQDCEIIRYTYYGIQTSIGASAYNGGLYIDHTNIYGTQYPNDYGGYTADKNQIGLNIRCADVIVDGCLIAVNYINAKFESLSNGQVSNCHFFNGAYQYATVSNCADNGSGKVRVTTAAAHNLIDGDWVTVASVVGTTEANGKWIITYVDTTNFDLNEVTFASAYISGGVVNVHHPNVYAGSGAHHVNFTNCYFDTTDIILRSFDHYFTGCMFTANDPDLVLVSTSAGETADELVVVGGRFANNDFLYRQHGTGTWGEKKAQKIGMSDEAGQGNNIMARTVIGSHERVFVSSNVNPMHQVHGLDTAAGHLVSVWANTATDAPFIWLAKSRGATVGTTGAVQSGDILGTLAFVGDDGTNGINVTGVGQVQGVAEENFSAGQRGSAIVIKTGTATTATGRVKVDQNGNLLPYANNTYSFGDGTYRWTEIFATNGVINTSDERDKKDIQDSMLGLSFINDLRPITYKWIVGKNEHTTEIVSPAKFDKRGKLISMEVTRDVITPIPGTRTHIGFLAQDVKKALDNAGVDCAAWILTDKNDPDSKQGLRSNELIPAIVKAIQELSASVNEMKSQIANIQPPGG